MVVVTFQPWLSVKGGRGRGGGVGRGVVGHIDTVVVVLIVVSLSC